MIKTFKKLCLIETFEERFEYLKLNGIVGRATFGFERYLNQSLYKSREWKLTRRDVIARDEGCDLGIFDRKIYGRVIIHHINPITISDIENHEDSVFDLNNLICASEETHNALHFGDITLLPCLPVERRKGDTCLWKPAY